MCTYVDVASFLALSFCETKQERLSFSQLSSLMSQVEPELSEIDAAIDWTRDSYMFATGFYKRFFETDDQEDGIRCSALSDLENELAYITGSVPTQIRESLKRSIHDKVEKGLGAY
ncbi:MAG: hypothetical protein WCP12_10225 [bacterium]